MSDASISSSIRPSSLDLKKWEFEKNVKSRELLVREREQATKENELELKRTEHTASHWRNPLVVGVFAAAIAAAGNAVISYTNANSQRQLESQKAEQARILEMIKTGDPDKAAENLEFLIDAGLISDLSLKTTLRLLEGTTGGRWPRPPICRRHQNFITNC